MGTELHKVNPFGEMSITTPARGGTAIADVAGQREVAEVQAAIILARRFPRNQIEAMDRILTACQRPTLAKQALYLYAKGGSEITGPTIRLAEAIAQNWGNMQFGIRELDQRNGESTVEAYAWDLETNVRQSKVFQVPHKRHTKKGSYALEDSRDIYELVANQGARRLRACLLGIIPGDVIEAAVEQVEQTMKANVDVTPESISKMVAKFGEYGVSKDQIEKRIQRRLDTIQPAQVLSLRKIYASIKDGMSATADWFETTDDQESTLAAQPQSGTDKAKEALKRGRKPKDTPVAQPEQTAEPAKVVDEPDELIDCPNGDRMKAGYCQTQCTSRENCPAWPEREPGMDNE